MRKSLVRRSAWFAVCIAALSWGAPSLAQDTGLNLIQTAEYDIGYKCPVASVLDPTGATLWVLLDNCFRSDFTLDAYNVADGARVLADAYADVLLSLDDDDLYVDPFITPLAFTPDGDLSVRYTNFQTYASFNLLIPLASGGEATTQADADYDALLAEYSEYPEFSVYSPDHTRVIATGATSFHILDVQRQTEIIEIPAEGSTDSALALFSADGERLEVTRNQSDDPDNHAVTLLIYSLPDGALLEEYELPSPAAWLSPDGAYAAVNLYSNNSGDQNELVVLELATGRTSQVSNLDEAPTPVTTCRNDGRNVSDLGYMTSGRFSFPALHWLPDSSGLVLALSYGGEGAGGGSICFFNTSRLRAYTVERAG